MNLEYSSAYRANIGLKRCYLKQLAILVAEKRQDGSSVTDQSIQLMTDRELTSKIDEYTLFLRRS